MSGERYQVIKGSQSGHCCFMFTVVDCERTDIKPFYPPLHIKPVEVKNFAVCECEEMKEALMICHALNYHNDNIKEFSK